MLLWVISFNLLLLAVCGYAALRGGAPERIVAALLFGSALATLAVQVLMHAQFTNPEVGTLIVDGVLLAGLLAVALQANRYWPIWMTAIHTIAVAVHGAKIAVPSLLPLIYSGAAGLSAFPILALLAIGTWRHRRRLKANGIDPSWNASLRRSG